MPENEPTSVLERVESGEVLGWRDVAQQIVFEGETIGLHPSVEKLDELMGEKLFYFGNGIFLEKVLEGIKHLKQKKGVEGKAKVMLVTTERGLGRWLKTKKGKTTERFKPFTDEADFTFFTSFPPEPSSAEVAKATIKAYKEGVDFIVAIGGGSSMDLAKGVKLCLGDKDISEGLTSLRDKGDSEKEREVGELIVDRFHFYLTGQVPWEERKAKLSLIAIPTTSGTGAEVTTGAVINDAATPEKDKSFFVAPVGADVVILDPKLVTTLPQKPTIATGIDALDQALEAFIGRKPEGDIPGSTSETLAMTGWALKLIGKNFAKVKENGQDLKARTAIHLASFLAGLGFENSHLGPVHDLGHPIGHLYHLSHGESLARILIPVLERHVFMAENPKRLVQVEEKYRDDVKTTAEMIAKGVKLLLPEQARDIKSPQTAIAKLKEYFEGLGVKTDLSDFAAKEADLGARIHYLLEKAKFPGEGDEEYLNLYDVPYWVIEDYEWVLRKALDFWKGRENRQRG